jgi:outer membrane protein assembly factor BamB/tetratricopeptide (TPR) repeat protein
VLLSVCLLPAGLVPGPALRAAEPGPPAAEVPGAPTYTIDGQTQVSRGAADPTGTDDTVTFRRARFGSDFTYVFTLPAGRYEMELGFCEHHVRRAGQRIFSVLANDREVIGRLDILAEAGGQSRALVKKAEVEVGRDGRLALRFRSERENACVSLIALRGAGQELVVRCGLESKPPGQAVVGFNIANLLEDERVGRLFEEAAAFEREAKYSEALSRYEQVLARYGGHMFAVEPGLYVPAGDTALERMGRLPESGLRLYRTLYNDKARALYEKALAAGDLGGLLEVARAYFPTDCGDDATYEAARIQLAAGRFEEAAAGLERLLSSHPDVSVPRADIVARLAVACRKLDRSRELADLTADAARRLAGERFSTGGGQRDLADFLTREVPLLRPRRPAATVEGAAAAGWEPQVDRQGRLALPAGALSLVWRAEIPGTQSGGGPGTGAVTELPFFAACRDRALYVAGPDGVDAWWLLNGERRWSYRSFGRSGAQIMAPAVAGGRVFVARPRFVPRGAEYKYIGERLVALDEAGGRRLWGDDGRGAAGEFDFLLAPNLRSPPAVVGETVLAYTQMEEIKFWRRWSAHPTLQAVDPATGRTVWERRLSTLLPRHRIMGIYVPGSALTVAGGVVYVLTNAGALAALDHDGGRVRWVRKYTQMPSGNDPERPPPAEARWALGAPLVAQGLVIVAPSDGEELLAMRADTGRLVWSRERRAGRQLLGAEGDCLILVTGERVQALDIFTGEEQWVRDLPGEPYGRGAIADGTACVPLRRGIWRARCSDGVEEPLLELPDASHSGNLAAVRAGFGTVLVTCSGTHLNVFYDRSAALERLAAESAAAPDAAVRGAADLARAEVLATAAGEGGGVEELCRAVLEKAPEEARRAGVPLRRIAGARLLESMRRRAEAAAAAGRPAAALAVWDEAVSSAASGSDEWVAAQAGRLRALEALERWPEAVGIYQELLARAPNVRVGVEPGLAMSAGEYAFRRLAAIRAQSAGRDPYAGFEKAAAALAGAGTPEADARLGREYPNSHAAAAALARLARSAGDDDRHVRLASLSALAARRPETAEGQAAAAALAPYPSTDTAFMEWGAVNYTAHRPPRTAAAPGAVFAAPFDVIWRIAAPEEDIDQVVLPVSVDGPGDAGGLVFVAQRRPSQPGGATLECRRAGDGGLVWKREISTVSGGEGGIGEVTVAGARVLAALGSELFGFDPSDGGKYWHLALPEKVLDLRGAGEVAVFTAGENLFAVDARSGRELWRRALSGMVYMGPTVDRGRVSLVLRHPDAIETYDLGSGDFVMRRELSRLYQEHYAARPTYAFDGATGVLVNGPEGPALEVYDLLTGALRGSSPAWLTPDGGGGGPLMFLSGGVNRAPAALGVFDLRTGKKLWQEAGGGGWAACADGVLYTGSRTCDAATGKQLWAAPAGVGGVTHCLVEESCLVLNSASRGGDRWSSQIAILDRKSGQRLGEFELRTRKLGRSPRGYGGTTLWLAGNVLVACGTPEVVGISGKKP